LTKKIVSEDFYLILVPNGFYFGKSNSIGFMEYIMSQSRQTEHDTISFGLQTSSMSAQIFRLESDVNSYSLEYEIVRRRFCFLREKKPNYIMDLGTRTIVYKIKFG